MSVIPLHTMLAIWFAHPMEWIYVGVSGIKSEEEKIKMWLTFTQVRMRNVYTAAPTLLLTFCLTQLHLQIIVFVLQTCK